jgi:hypothetical protein
MFDEKSYQKQYREKNKEKLSEYYKKYRQKNADSIREYSKEYQKKHKDDIKERTNKWRNDNKDDINAKRQIWRKSSVRSYFSKKVWDLKKKKHHGKTSEKYKSEITLDFLVQLWESQGGQCAITGKKMEHKPGSLFSASVDRIDSNIGYYEGNVHLVCQGINFAKNDYPHEQFLNFWVRVCEDTTEPEYFI